MPRRRLRDLSIVQNTPNSEERNSEQQTAIGSLNVPNTPDEPVKIQSNVIKSSIFSRIFEHYSTKCQYVAYQLRFMASNA
ncbi:hypothetical protein Gotur_014153 [Gossypium turneri]